MRKSAWAVIIAATMAMFLVACGEEKPLTFDVLVGEEDKVQGLAIQTFLPNDLTVNVGDTIRFTKRTGEPHTVTFNVPEPRPPDFIPRPDGGLEANPEIFFPFPLSLSPPPPPGPPSGPPPPTDIAASFDGAGYLNSGFLASNNDVISVTFTKTGAFAYQCLLHPTHMKGTITVQAEGKSRPKTAEVYAKEGADHLAVHKANAKAFRDDIQVPAPGDAASGTRNFTVWAGTGDDPKGNDFLAFIGGENLSVKAGDTVTWKMEKNVPGVPHTITFLSGHEHPPLIIPEPQPAGPPKLLLNPALLPPSPLPPAPYAGEGLFHSGFLLTGGPTPQEFTLAFTKPGIYKYLCLLHDPAGMNGTITVQ